jgi:hypothetical protein
MDALLTISVVMMTAGDDRLANTPAATLAMSS